MDFHLRIFTKTNRQFRIRENIWWARYNIKFMRSNNESLIYESWIFCTKISSLIYIFSNVYTWHKCFDVLKQTLYILIIISLLCLRLKEGKIFKLKVSKIKYLHTWSSFKQMFLNPMHTFQHRLPDWGSILESQLFRLQRF